MSMSGTDHHSSTSSGENGNRHGQHANADESATAPVVDTRQNVARELLFLVSDFLDRCSPLQKSAAVLRQELAEEQLLPMTTDWKGNTRIATVAEMQRQTSLLRGSHLVDLVDAMLHKVQHVDPEHQPLASTIGPDDDIAAGCPSDPGSVSLLAATPALAHANERRGRRRYLAKLAELQKIVNSRHERQAATTALARFPPAVFPRSPQRRVNGVDVGVDLCLLDATFAPGTVVSGGGWRCGELSLFGLPAWNDFALKGATLPELDPSPKTTPAPASSTSTATTPGAPGAPGAPGGQSNGANNGSTAGSNAVAPTSAPGKSLTILGPSGPGSRVTLRALEWRKKPAHSSVHNRPNASPVVEIRASGTRAEIDKLKNAVHVWKAKYTSATAAVAQLKKDEERVTKELRKLSQTAFPPALIRAPDRLQIARLCTPQRPTQIHSLLDRIQKVCRATVIDRLLHTACALKHKISRSRMPDFLSRSPDSQVRAGPEDLPMREPAVRMWHRRPASPLLVRSSPRVLFAFGPSARYVCRPFPSRRRSGALFLSVRAAGAEQRPPHVPIVLH